MVDRRLFMYLPSHLNPIVKLTEECNYCCNFCRYADHRQKDGGISVDTVCSVIQQCAEYNLQNGVQSMNIIFHGGEPLLYGMDRFLEIMDFEERISDSGITISNSIQTNSSLIDDKWIDFFSQNRFSVGISIDGPHGLNGHYASSASDAQSKAILSYKALKDQSVACGILSVITEKHLDCPEVFFDFLVINNIMSVGLCYCFNSADDKNVNPIHLGYYLIELYKLYFNSTKRINIREFDMATRLILNRPRNECAMSCRKSCGTFLSVRPDGCVEFCDDYNLNREGTLGNINEYVLTELLRADTYQKMKRQAVAIVENKCKNCSVYNICQSGCMRSDIGDSNYFCETYKILYPFIQKTVEEYLNFK